MAIPMLYNTRTRGESFTFPYSLSCTKCVSYSLLFSNTYSLTSRLHLPLLASFLLGLTPSLLTRAVTAWMVSLIWSLKSDKFAGRTRRNWTLNKGKFSKFCQNGPNLAKFRRFSSILGAHVGVNFCPKLLQKRSPKLSAK